MYVHIYLTCVASPQCMHLDSKLENMISTLRSEVSANQEAEAGAASKKVPCMLSHVYNLYERYVM